ncbi:MAG: RNA-binding protein [Bryobacteraceae bacterium]|jgi:RNA recognition motif-containing protein
MKNIYVGNLDFGATEDSIRALFEPHGTVERVSLVRDRDTGQSRGFAFVEMTNAAEADRAIAALNGTQVGGRALSVNEARPRPERGGGGGGFRRNSGGGGGGGGYGRRREPRW